MTTAPAWALVTGAGSGIGAALASELAQRGCRLVLVGRRAATLEATRASLADPQAAICCPCDLANAAARGRLIDDVAARLGAAGGDLRCLVHNAGVGVPGPDFAGMACADLGHALAVNVVAPLALTQGWLPLMGAGRPSARILLVGAGIADRPQPGTGAYGISKKAEQRLFEQMVVDFAAERGPNPRVGLFQPGIVDTAGLREHCRRARACGLPHVDYLESVLDAGNAWTAEAVAHAMSRALLDADEDAFHGQVLRTADWQGV